MKTTTLRPFDLEAAKAGAPVVTRDGRPARIVCFDAAGEFPVIALIRYGTDEEVPQSCTLTGRVSYAEDSVDDLFMIPVKRKGYVNLYRYGNAINSGLRVHNNEDEAKNMGRLGDGYVATVAIEWEE